MNAPAPGLDDGPALPAWMANATPRTRYGPDWRARAGHLRTCSLDDWHAANARAARAVEALSVRVEGLHTASRFERVRPSVWTCRVRVGPLDVPGVGYRVDWNAPLATARRLSLPAWLDDGAHLDGLPGGLALRRAVADAVAAAVALDVATHAPPGWPLP